MTTISEMYDRMKRLTDNFKSDVSDIVDRTSYEIEALNKQQLYRGQDSKGYELHPMYGSESYANYKQAINSNPSKGVPDLFLTGAFYKGFGVVVSNYKYTIDSSDYKATNLKTKYGQDIFGLQESSKEIYTRDTLRPEIQKHITNITGLTFT